MKNKRGFTLPELLITIGIVGVVAALLVPTLVKLRPDYNKVMYLKAYDALVSVTDAVAHDQDIYSTKYYDSTTSKQYDVKRYPLLDVGTGSKYQYSGKNKLGNVLKEVLGGGSNEPVTNFNTKNGINWNIDESQYDFGSNIVKFRNKVIIDVDGLNKGKNAFYTDTNRVTSPDRFIFYISSNGTVQPADKYGQMYLATRDKWTKNGEEGTIIANGPYIDLTGTDISNDQTDYDNGWGVETREVLYNDDGTDPVNPCPNMTGTAYESCMCTNGYKSHCEVCADAKSKSTTEYNACMCSKGYSSYCSCPGKTGNDLLDCRCDAGDTSSCRPCRDKTDPAEYADCMCNAGYTDKCTVDPCAGKSGEEKAKCECSKTYTANTAEWEMCVCAAGYSGHCPACYGLTGTEYENCMCTQNPGTCDPCSSYTENTKAWYKCMCDNGTAAYCCSGYSDASHCCASDDCSCNCEYNNKGDSTAISSCKCSQCGVGCTVDPCAGKKGTELCKCQNDESDWCDICEVGCSEPEPDEPEPDPCEGKTGMDLAQCDCDNTYYTDKYRTECMCGKGYANDSCPCAGKSGDAYDECMCDKVSTEYCPDSCAGADNYAKCKCDDGYSSYCCSGYNDAAHCCGKNDCGCKCEYNHKGDSDAIAACKCDCPNANCAPEDPCKDKSEGFDLDSCRCENSSGDYDTCMCDKLYNSYCKDPCEEKCEDDDDCYCKCSKCNDSNTDDCYCKQCKIGCDPCASINKAIRPQAWACCQYDNFGTYGCQCKQDADHCCDDNNCECKCNYANDKEACLCNNCNIGCDPCKGKTGTELCKCQNDKSDWCSKCGVDCPPCHDKTGTEYNKCMCDEGYNTSLCCDVYKNAEYCCTGETTSKAYHECVCSYSSDPEQCVCDDSMLGSNNKCPCKGKSGNALKFCECRLSKSEDECNCEVYNSGCGGNNNQSQGTASGSSSSGVNPDGGGSQGNQSCEDLYSDGNGQACNTDWYGIKI